MLETINKLRSRMNLYIQVKKCIFESTLRKYMIWFYVIFKLKYSLKFYAIKTFYFFIENVAFNNVIKKIYIYIYIYTVQFKKNSYPYLLYIS